MPGTQLFTYANAGKETVRGTPVAPTRWLAVEGTGVLEEDLGLVMHDAENRGVRTRIARAPTMTREAVALNLASVDGVSFDEFVLALSQLKGGLSGVGAGADKTWTCAPSMTAANNPEAYSIDVGDDVQNWRVQYAMASEIKLSGAAGELTKMTLTMFGQRAVKGAKAAVSPPAVNVKIPGLWTLKSAASIAGLTAASVLTNLLIDWELTIRTGLVPRFYLDGNLYMGQHVETDIGADLALTVESTAGAVSGFYDKWKAQTADFLRLKATGPSLGASNYSAQIDLPVYYTDVKPIGAADGQINLYKIGASLAYDPVSAASIQAIVVNSLAALP